MKVEEGKLKKRGEGKKERSEGKWKRGEELKGGGRKKCEKIK